MTTLHGALNDMFPELQDSDGRRTQSGISTSEVVVTSHSGSNNEVFPHVLGLYVADGARIADVTYGKGVFWRDIDVSKYDFLPSDIKTGTDARSLPYEDESLDAIVFDPPYMEGLYRRDTSHLAGGGTHAAFREFYSNGETTPVGKLRYHDVVLDMYMSVACEAHRTLKRNGVFIVKCQDEVSANRQKLTHVEIIYGYESLGFYCKDLFVVTRLNRPVVSRLLRQEHARKNHSYFLIFIKSGGKLPYSNFRDLLRSYQDRIRTHTPQTATPRLRSKRVSKSSVQSDDNG